MSGIVASVLTPHTPRMAIEATAPDFVRPLIDGSRALGAALRALEPDLFVLQSTHWVSTFNWYATAHAVHEGRCIAEEAPDMISGIAYRRRGEPAFARALIETVSRNGVPCFANESEHYHWDYGSLVPLLYIDPDATVPVVTLPTVLMADLIECRLVGRLVHETAKTQGKRVVHIASSALSHALVRGPEHWPSEACMALDRRFVELACDGQVEELVGWLPEWSKAAVAEMGGRVLATWLGTLEAFGPQRLHGRQYGGYAQSSGTGNVSVMVSPEA